MTEKLIPDSYHTMTPYLIAMEQSNSSILWNRVDVIEVDRINGHDNSIGHAAVDRW